MGWCRGTQVFDGAIEGAIDAGVKGEALTTFAVMMISILDDLDWDCQSESQFFDNDGPIGAAFRQVYPDWFVDEDD